MTSLTSLAVLLCLLAAPPMAAATLDLYFIDVEQGSAMLMVAPSGESVLFDSGSKGNDGRDVDRVLSAMKAAGVTRIDRLIVSHYHNDHFGAVPDLARKIPIRRFIDHGDNVESGKTPEWHKHWQIGADEELWKAYREARSKAPHTVVKPGDRIPVRGIDIQVLASAGRQITGPLPGAGSANPSCAITPLRSEDETEDGQSVGILVAFGKFRFITLADLTWNKIRRMFCPVDKIGKVDVYVTSHHAMSIDRETAGEVRWGRSACSEAELHALRPRVAILNYGESYHRLGGPRGWRVVRDSPGLQGFWQLHYQAGGGPENNMPEQYIANLAAQNCQGHWIKLSARSDGSFTVVNTRNELTKTYPASSQ